MKIEVNLFGDVSLESFFEVYHTHGGDCWTAWIDICGLDWDTSQTVFMEEYNSKEEAERGIEEAMMSLLHEIADNCQNKFAEMARRKDGRETV